MRSRTMMLAGASVALLGALVVFAYAKSVTSGAGGGSSISAYVATKDIGAGTKWEDAQKVVAKQNVPESLRPASAIGSPVELAGRTSVRQIAKGEVVTVSQFGTSAAAPGLGLEIPPKLNAVTINIPPPRGVAYYPQAGDLVNVYTTIKTVDGKTTTKLLLSNVQILSNHAAGTQTSEGVSNSGEILFTLALSPDKSEKLIFAKENGSLWFGLVRPGDPAATTAGRNITNVFGE
jgi:Flp pilus assembly protein CpaB